MLPGFRFLFAAIVLSLSILVFGLGAAALLRAAHEEFASTPSWRAAPETMFAQQSEAARPTLTMLRVDPPAEELKAPDSAPAVAAPAEDAGPGEQAPITSMPAESERIAALKPEDSSLLETVKPEIPVSETPAQSEAVPAQADAPAPADQTKIAASEQVSSSGQVLPPAQLLPPANEAGPTTSEQPSAPASPDAELASTKIATLGGPPVTTEAQPPANAASAKPDKSVIKKRRLQARRAAERRRMALRARLEAQQPANPFAQPVAADRKR
jgi:hypothetical protein